MSAGRRPHRGLLSDRDRVLVFEQRGPENRLGLAVSLCALRFLGFVPDDIASIPDDALAFVADQVDAAAHELLAYGGAGKNRVTSRHFAGGLPERLLTGRFRRPRSRSRAGQAWR